MYVCVYIQKLERVNFLLQAVGANADIATQARIETNVRGYFEKQKQNKLKKI